MKRKTKNIFLILGSTAVAGIIGVILFMGMIPLSLILHQLALSPDDLGGGYCVDYELYATLGENYNGNSWSIYDESMCIRDYKVTDTHIFIYAFTAPDAMKQDKIYKYSQMSDLKQLAAGFEDVFYIVDKNRRDVLGPMDIKEYVEMREKLGVPDDMTLKIKLKI
jgi:hypothetical protein